MEQAPAGEIQLSGPKKAKWEKKVDSAVFAAAFTYVPPKRKVKSEFDGVKEEKPPPPPPVEIKVSPMSEDGNLDLDFN